MKRILITVPGLGEPGGVANYYLTLGLDGEPDIDYLAVTGGDRGMRGRLVRLTRVYLSLLLRLPRVHTVLVNPSLTRNSFWRDALIVLLARALCRRVLVFWRGWDWDYFEQVERSALHRFCYRHTYGRAGTAIYLARAFCDAIAPLGASPAQRALFETTVADDRQVDESESADSGDEINLLFMSRMDRAKGIYVVLDAYQELKRRHPQLSLTMAGSGDELDNARDHAARLALADVEFPGYIRGVDKHRALSRAAIFFFPTSYGEGMPNCVLEALAYGIPVVSRNNAGIPDVVSDGVNGFLSDGSDAAAFVPLVEKLITDPVLRRRMGSAARAGSERFSAPAVRERMLRLLRSDPQPAD